MEDLLKRISQKKQQLDGLKPFPKELEQNLGEWFAVELTYSSNAIEGNTLTRIETAEVIEKGATAVISGKPLKDLLEARNHAQALEFIKQLAKQRKSHQFITEQDIKDIHKIILTGIDDNWTGKYRLSEVFMRGSDTEFSLPNAIPNSMQGFIQWLTGQQETHPVRVAAEAHYRLVTIHPFIDGNGRTARLLMNLILIINGYPMAIIRNEDRIKYLGTFYQARKHHNMQPFYDIVEQAVEHSLDKYITAVLGKSITPQVSTTLLIPEVKLLKIGALAKETGETVHTLRFWTKQGLLEVKEHTEGGYQLYDSPMIEKVRQIRRLQEKRLTISEIRNHFRK